MAGICSAHQGYEKSCPRCNASNTCPTHHGKLELEDGCAYCKFFMETEERKVDPFKRAEYRIKRGDIGCPDCKVGPEVQCKASFEHAVRKTHHARYTRKLALQLLELVKLLQTEHAEGTTCFFKGHQYTICIRCESRKQIEELTRSIDDLGTGA